MVFWVSTTYGINFNNRLESYKLEAFKLSGQVGRTEIITRMLHVESFSLIN